jgi:nucleotide-binding universal stress UspA family protein
MDLRTVLCPVDLTPLSNRAVDLGVALCRRFGARLVLEHNLESRPPAGLAVTWMWAEGRGPAGLTKDREAERELRQLLARLPAGFPREAKLTRGPIDLGVLQVAALLPADLIVMASHGGSSSEHRSLTEAIVEAAPCPVLTLTEGSADAPFLDAAPGASSAAVPVVVPVDFSAHSGATIRYALSFGEAFPVELHFLHVAHGRFHRGDLESDRRQLEALVPESRRGRAQFHVQDGAPADRILRLSGGLGAKLVLMGRHSKTALERLFTPATAREVLHRSSCPVWFVA